eukprot:tig00000851_g4895.t1
MRAHSAQRRRPTSARPPSTAEYGAAEFSGFSSRPASALDHAGPSSTSQIANTAYRGITRVGRKMRGEVEWALASDEELLHAEELRAQNRILREAIVRAYRQLESTRIAREEISQRVSQALDFVYSARKEHDLLLARIREAADPEGAAAAARAMQRLGRGFERAWDGLVAAEKELRPGAERPRWAREGAEEETRAREEGLWAEREAALRELERASAAHAAPAEERPARSPDPSSPPSFSPVPAPPGPPLPSPGPVSPTRDSEMLQYSQPAPPLDPEAGLSRGPQRPQTAPARRAAAAAAAHQPAQLAATGREEAGAAVEARQAELHARIERLSAAIDALAGAVPAGPPHGATLRRPPRPGSLLGRAWDAPHRQPPSRQRRGGRRLLHSRPAGGLAAAAHLRPERAARQPRPRVGRGGAGEGAVSRGRRASLGGAAAPLAEGGAGRPAAAAARFADMRGSFVRPASTPPDHEPEDSWREPASALRPPPPPVFGAPSPAPNVTDPSWKPPADAAGMGGNSERRAPSAASIEDLVAQLAAVGGPAPAPAPVTVPPPRAPSPPPPRAPSPLPPRVPSLPPAPAPQSQPAPASASAPPPPPQGGDCLCSSSTPLPSAARAGSSAGGAAGARAADEHGACAARGHRRPRRPLRAPRRGPRPRPARPELPGPPPPLPPPPLRWRRPPPRPDAGRPPAPTLAAPPAPTLAAASAPGPAAVASSTEGPPDEESKPPAAEIPLQAAESPPAEAAPLAPPAASEAPQAQAVPALVVGKATAGAAAAAAEELKEAPTSFETRLEAALRQLAAAPLVIVPVREAAGGAAPPSADPLEDSFDLEEVPAPADVAGAAAAAAAAALARSLAVSAEREAGREEEHSGGLGAGPNASSSVSLLEVPVTPRRRL